MWPWLPNVSHIFVRSPRLIIGMYVQNIIHFLAFSVIANCSTFHLHLTRFKFTLKCSQYSSNVLGCSFSDHENREYAIFDCRAMLNGAACLRYIKSMTGNRTVIKHFLYILTYSSHALCMHKWHYSNWYRDHRLRYFSSWFQRLL